MEVLEDQEYELQINSNEICRACLTQEDNLKNIFCNDIVDGNIINFPNIYELVTGLKVKKNDGYPENICILCKGKINELYIFKEKCKRSFELLQKLFKPNDVQTDNVELEKSEDFQNQEYVETDINTIKTDLEINKSLLELVDENIEYDIIDKILPNTLKCDLCNISYESLDKYQKHMESHEAEEFKCYYCSKSFDNDLLREEHISNDHNQDDTDNSSKVLNPTINKTYSEDGSYYEIETIRTMSESSSIVDECDEYIEGMIDDEQTTYECLICNEEFSKQNLYFEHLKNHDIYANQEHPVKTKKRERSTSCRYKCPLCKIIVKHQDQIDKHIEFHRKTINLVLDAVYFFKCSNCRSVFFNAEQLENHFTSNEKRVCAPCPLDKSYTDYQFIEYGITPNATNNSSAKVVSCFKSKTNELQCEQCLDYSASTVEELLKHIIKNHSSPIEEQDISDSTSSTKPLDDEAHMCGFCNLVFSNINSARLHVYFYIKFFSCPFPNCGSEYDSFVRLNSHMYKTHAIENEYICYYCNEKFKQYEELKKHFKMECNKRTLSCTICNKKYISQFSLNNHMKIHTREKKFVCHYCGKGFIQSGDLATHRRLHTGEKPFKCTICHKTFRTTSHRKDHMTSHNTDRPFECNICKKKFKSERVLKSHMELHIGPKKCECTICGRRFARKQHVTAHMKRHLRDFSTVQKIKEEEEYENEDDESQ